jgi:hypothetical protein
VNSDTPRALSEFEEQILAFESQWFHRAGAKESEIRDQFDLSPTRYYELLNQLIDREEALAKEPVLVARLRRIRQERLAQRQDRPSI